MVKHNFFKALTGILALVAVGLPGFAQSSRKPVVFAVVNDGKSVEPLAFIDNGKLVAAVGGDTEGDQLKNFRQNYYKPKTNYTLIFGGANAGTAQILKFDPQAECAPHMADVFVKSDKAKLGGFVMALATDAPVGKNASGLRRRPTAAERTQIETLIRAFLTREKVRPAVQRTLKSHNLTALDVDNDGRVEFVGTYWVTTSATTRGLLFFIADRNAAGKYEFGFSEYSSVKQDDVMNGDIKTLDTGIYHELLLDAFDYNGDGTSEIFTYSRAFEGVSFAAYRKSKGKWVRDFEGANYHCAF